MPLPPGTRLGVYEVTAQIGAGGMGEVYQANDTKLKRQVALKILPPTVAGDPDRLARFQREAEVLASLNHPHIAHIHGFEESNGVTALIMELVEGEDLSHRLARGAIPLDEALPIAKQIAEALEAAHEQGIIHRDLKPANIKLRPDGTVKVLDFGIAKAITGSTGSAGSAGSNNAPTITTPAMTQAGMVLGTAAYMAPEQAKGKFVDKRVDIWAFGVVLYEMLTGKRLFDAEDVTETLAAVLTRDVSMTTMPVAIPARLRTLLRDCLIRDPKQRLRDIGDARIVLDKIIAGAADDAMLPPPAAATRPTSTAVRALPWAIAASFASAALLLWAPWRVEQPIDRPLVRLDVDLGADAAFPPANTISGSTLAISPDGSRLAYVSGTPPRLFTRRLDQAKVTELPGTQGAAMPFFSPDGQWIGFGGNGRISKISVEGGAAVRLAAANASGGSWAEDGSLIVSEIFGRGLMQFPAVDSGEPRVIAPVVGGAGHVVPQPLPGGQALLAAFCTLGSADNCNIEAVALADGKRTTLARAGHSPHYVPSSNGSGHLLYINGATVFAIPFDPVKLETRGTAVPVLDDVGFVPTTGAGMFAISRTGTMIYRLSRGAVATQATVQWVEAARKAPLRAKPGAYADPQLSPDGKRIALSITEGPNQDIWAYDPERDAITRLTFGGVNRAPVWSPDGKTIVFAKVGDGMFQTRADGASQPQRLMESRTSLVPWSMTPDGKRLAYFSIAKTVAIWTVPLDDQGGQLRTGKPEQFLASSNFLDTTPAFSPDGHWLAYVSNESGRTEVYVRAFPPPSSGPGGKWQISNDGGGSPRWSAAGHDLVYQNRNQLMAVSYSVKGDTFVAEKPRVWIDAFGSTAWDLAPDGKRVAALIPETTPQIPQQERTVVMLQNLADELRRRVPLGK